jgi:hypothetical protein
MFGNAQFETSERLQIQEHSCLLFLVQESARSLINKRRQELTGRENTHRSASSVAAWST